MENLKTKVVEAIRQSEAEINEGDLQTVQSELIKFIDRYKGNSSGKISETINDQSDHKSIFPGKEKKPRIVVIGDLHCDFTSLKAILQKLYLSNYDYFERAYFIFLGDYIDRGAMPLETFRLIFRLKEILGSRCILLRGNHDTILYNEEEDEFYSNVTPSETVGFMNQYFDKRTIGKFKEFFEFLPFYAFIERNNRRYLLVHGGIPKDIYIGEFKLDAFDMLKLPLDKPDEFQQRLIKTLWSMLWGDPSDAKIKNQSSSTRFEFGSEQFETFLKKSNLTHIIRSHEPAVSGYDSKFGDRLFTVYSTGGTGNQSSYYADSVVSPSYAVIDEEGVLTPEAIFTYRVYIEINGKSERQALEQITQVSILSDSGPYGFKFESAELKDVNKETHNERHAVYLNDEFSIKIQASSIPLFFRDKYFSA